MQTRKPVNPSQKLLALLEKILHHFTSLLANVLDLCIGTGSLLIACMNLLLENLGIALLLEELITIN